LKSSSYDAIAGTKLGSARIKAQRPARLAAVLSRRK
jgi:hypothetical protein